MGTLPAPPGRIRIGAGEWRSRVVDVPAAEGLRPSPARVRETLFNWLGQHLDGRACLDLFAGSGILGFEAVSRGAARSVLVERDRAVLAALRANAERLRAGDRVRIVQADAMRFLESDPSLYDVIFLDPPYRAGWIGRLLPVAARRLTARGVVYAESERGLAPEPGWTVLREGTAGQVCHRLLAPQAADDGVRQLSSE